MGVLAGGVAAPPSLLPPPEDEPTVIVAEPVLKYYLPEERSRQPSSGRYMETLQIISKGTSLTHPLGGDNLVVVRAQVEAGLGPCVEMVGHVHRAAGPLGLPDRPVLVKGRCAVDTRLVDPLRPVDVVRATVRCHGTKAGGTRAGVVGSKVLDNIVLDQRVPGPAVDGEVRVSVGRVRSGVSNRARGARVPTCVAASLAVEARDYHQKSHAVDTKH